MPAITALKTNIFSYPSKVAKMEPAFFRSFTQFKGRVRRKQATGRTGGQVIKW
jgi:hypothetical protein